MKWFIEVSKEEENLGFGGNVVIQQLMKLCIKCVLYQRSNVQ